MQVAKKVIEGTKLTFNWADETSTSFVLSAYPASMVEALAMHGLKQKLGDTYSGALNNGWDIARCKLEVEEVHVSMVSGDFNRKGGGASTGGILIEAIAAVTGATIEDVLTKWNAMDDDTKASIKKREDVKVEQRKIELARAVAKAESADTTPLSI